MPLQIRRGTAAERNALTAPLVVGELLYTTDGKLYIGDGTAIGSSDLVGNVGQGGKGLIITGFTAEEARDATAELFANGTHNNILFIYDDNANSLSAQVDLSSTPYNGNVTFDGNVTVTGDLQASGLKSSIFADNSTLLVDAVSGIIPAEVVSGTFTGSVKANDTTTLVDAATGVVRCTDFFINSANITSVGAAVNLPANSTIDGSAFGFSIVGDDSTITSVDPSDTLRIFGSFGIRTFVNPEGEFFIENENNLLSPTPVDISKTTSHHLTFVEDLFDQNQPMNTAGALRYVPNTETLTVTNIQTATLQASTSISTTDIFAGQIYANNALYLISLLTTGTTRRQVSVGDTTTSGRFQVINSTYEAGFPMISIQQSHDTPDALNFGFYRTRNNASSPTAVASGDDLADITFNGWDGSAWATGAAINVTVDGTVSSGITPTQITIETMNDAGVRSNAVTINKNQQTLFNGAIQLKTYANPTARDTAIPSPTAGMVVFLTDSTGAGGAPKAQVNTDGTTLGWSDLN